MAKRKVGRKTMKASRGGRYSQKRRKTSRGQEWSIKHQYERPETEVEGNETIEATEKLYAPISGIRSFKVTHEGKQKEYAIHTGYGYFIPSLKKAENLVQVNDLVESGIPSKEVDPIIEYLDLKVPEIAKAAAVSPSTVSRWKADTSIGISGSNQFFRIDQVIRKGVDLFGGPEEFKGWLHSPNQSLGNNVPAKLITSSIGVDMVDEALDALHYGNVM
jgi:putative toxin-antitoxin system antitoxin component (TIGR02293 family)